MLSLRPQTLRALADSLEHRSPLYRDWRGLAECIGFSAKHIRRIEAPHQHSSTRRVLDAWYRSGRSSVRKLIIALRYLNYIECTQILEKEPSLQGGCFFLRYVTRDITWSFSFTFQGKILGSCTVQLISSRTTPLRNSSSFLISKMASLSLEMTIGGCYLPHPNLFIASTSYTNHC